MIPKIGQHAKCILRTGAIVEGIVEEWGSSIQLKSLDGESILIIPHPNDDIMLIKIVLTKSQPAEIVPKTELEKEFKETYEKPSDNDLRIKKMAELKIMMNDQERKIIADKLKSHQITDVKQVQYGYPQLNKMQRSK